MRSSRTAEVAENSSQRSERSYAATAARSASIGVMITEATEMKHQIGCFLFVEEDNIFNKRGDYLGEISWHPRWRCHVFESGNPEKGEGLFFSAGCLQDIATELKRRDEARKKKKKG